MSGKTQAVLESIKAAIAEFQTDPLSDEPRDLLYVARSEEGADYMEHLAAPILKEAGYHRDGTYLWRTKRGDKVQFMVNEYLPSDNDFYMLNVAWMHTKPLIKDFEFRTELFPARIEVDPT